MVNYVLLHNLQLKDPMCGSTAEEGGLKWYMWIFWKL